MMVLFGRDQDGKFTCMRLGQLRWEEKWDNNDCPSALHIVHSAIMICLERGGWWSIVGRAMMAASKAVSSAKLCKGCSHGQTNPHTAARCSWSSW
jgi:hypothetical protein